MYKIILYLTVGFSLIFAYTRYIEIRSIFFPTKEIDFTPADISLSFEDIFLNSADKVKINGWFIPSYNARYTLFFLHGNGGNISHRLEKIGLFNKIGLNMFIIDYRGYGRSQGRPSEAGLYLDAKAAYNYLIKERKINPEDVILYGESLGTAVAIDLASKAKVKALVLEGAFSSGRDMARHIYPLIPSLLFSNKFNSLEKITKIQAAKLFLHSRNDEIVPIILARKLFEHASQPKYFGELIGSHNTASLDSKDKYLSTIASFINNL